MQETQKTQVQSLYQEGPLEDEWQLTPVSLPGKSHGQRSLAGYSPRGHRVGQNWACMGRTAYELEMIKLSEVIQM